jgi:putative ferric enterobactin transport system permease protein fepG
VGLALLVVLTVVAVASVSTGAYPVSPAQVSAAIFGYGQEDSYARYFVTQVRAPRIATAMLVGSALGLSGALFQAVSGNPLGSPDIIGFTTGAATGALVAIILVGASPLGVSLGAIAGGVGAAALVYMLAWKNGITGNRLVLVGIGLAAVEHALNKLLIVRAPLANAQQAAQWQAGSLNDANWAWLAWLALALVVLTPALACLTRPLSTLALGDELAHGLGTRVQATRSGALAVGVTLVALATAVTGPIAFVALAAPHLARRASGAPGVNLTNSALMGATLVVVADFVAQRALAPTQLAVGVVTATLGGLYLVLFLVLQWRKGI